MIAVSRRRFLQMTAAGVAAANGRIAMAAPSPSLGAIAAKNGYLFGAAAAEVIDKDAAYRDLYVTQTKIITTDVALKIGRIAPQPGPKHFESADRLLAFCDQHGIAMRGHCLIWNEWNPAWVTNMTANERRMYFDSYIEEVVARYSGKLQSWDIVNEPFWPGHNAPGGFRLGPWYDAFGPDYIRRAFERAARVDRTTKFVLNEAQTERDDELGLAVRRGLLKLVADLKNFNEFLHTLAGLGVDIYITEFDVSDDVFPDDIEARDAAVARTARQFLEPTLRHPAVKALITWELADNYSFYRGIFRAKNPTAARLPRPLPYDDRLQTKPLWGAIAQAFQSARRPDPSTNGRAR